MRVRTHLADCDIHQAGVVDVADVVFLTQRAYAEPFRAGAPVAFIDEDEESLAREMDRGWKLLVARYGGLAVGAIRWRCERDEVRLSRLAVDPRHRRRGIGTALLHAVEKEACDRGAAGLCVEMLAESGVPPMFQRRGYAVRAERLAGPVRFLELAKRPA